MRAFVDGRVDRRSAKAAENAAHFRSVDDVLQDVNQFRGRVISLTYNLERLVDALIVWHLFRDRDDGTAAIFEDDILHDGGFGLERKVRLAKKVAEYWAFDDDGEAMLFAKSLFEAKSYRDRVAHWPVRLQPLVDENAQAVDYLAHLEKGTMSFALTSVECASWLENIESASRYAKSLIGRIEQHCRDMPD